ncbi:MAG TPA: T9SS type A sorting domain-containing protein [Bacteroidia bacterium]|nr:T9SS type A sorting domain-containing protein [Bacteroidia bacterium]
MKKVYLLLIVFLITTLTQAQTLDSITPNSGIVGQQILSTNISATNLFQVASSPNGNIYEINLKKGAASIPVYNMWGGVWPSNVNVIDPNNATADFSIPANADTGLYDLELTTTDPFNPGSNLILYTAPNAFTVTPPDGYLSGKVFYDTNENGIFDAGDVAMVNQLIQIQPGNLQQQTDANGDFNYGVSNGTYTVSLYSSGSHSYVLSTDSVSYTVQINNASATGLDFGLIDGLTSLSPATAFQGQVLNANITSRLLFVAGGSPWGNITSAYIRRTTSPTIQYSIPNTSFVVIDSTNAQLVFQISVSANIGVYDLVINISNKQYFLEDALTITTAPASLSGLCYYDSNNNASFDIGEPPIENVRLSLSPEASFAFSNVSGNFVFGAELGSHVLSYSPTPASPFVLTTAPSYSFTNTGNQSGFDFGFRSSLPDYTCDVTFNPGVLRCLQSVTSRIIYSNTSNAVCQGQIYLVHSSNTTFNSSTPPASSMNGDTIFWNFSGLQPMATSSISVSLTNPAAGSIISFLAGIRVEDQFGTQQFEDTSSNSRTVLCSYDPNDKAAFPEGENDIMHYTLNYEPIEYLIRFQNTGNDTAFTVYIRDTIDASFDLNTLEVLGSSHTVQTEVDSNRAIVFMFANILLADSIVDEPNSHGFVRYRIRPLAGIPDPTVVENTAYIYFDLNPAVVTNTTWNTLVQMLPVGIGKTIKVDDGVFFYPNPMDEIGYLSFNNPLAHQMRLEIYDLKGGLVSVKESSGSLFQIDRKGFSSGLYLFRLINNNSGKVNSGKVSFR